MIPGKPTKEDVEFDDLRNFFKLRRFDINQFIIEGPRATFPDFIISQSDKTQSIEITRAPTDKRRMQGKNDYDSFLLYICPILQQLNIAHAFLMPDGPTLWSIDAYKHREEIAEWIKSVKDGSEESISAKFGECRLELRDIDGQRTLGFWIWDDPYCINDESIGKYCRNIAGYIASAIKKKIGKYKRGKRFADLLIIKPDYWEPMSTSNKEQMSKLLNLAKREMRNSQYDKQPLQELIPQYFGEVWILMHNVTFRIFPVG